MEHEETSMQIQIGGHRKGTEPWWALVDKEDYERINQFHWSKHSKGYAIRQCKNKRTFLHREVLLTKSKLQIDHINGNKLDNRKKNLRLCTQSQNNWNSSKKRNNTTGFKGVYLDNRNRYKRWYSNILVDGKVLWLGSFYSPEEAARAYDLAVKANYGEYARPNF